MHNATANGILHTCYAKTARIIIARVAKDVIVVECEPYVGGDAQRVCCRTLDDAAKRFATFYRAHR